MEPRDYLDVLRRRWLSVVIAVLACLALTTAGTLLMTKQYTATTRLFFGVQGGESVSDLAQGSTFTEKQMSSYAQVARSPLVLDRVIKRLRLSDTAESLAADVTASAPADTVILEIHATSTEPRLAAQIANAIGAELTSVAGDLSPERPDGSEAVRATILATARVPLEPSSPVVLRNLALGLVLGLLVGIGIALLRQAMDTKVRSERDVAAITDGVILGVIPFDPAAPSQPVAMHEDRLGARSEAVRRLRTNLQFVEVARSLKSVVITSSIPGEGKTTTAINLGVSLADASLRVLIVDADLRRPSVADFLGLEGSVGLTTVLIGRADLSDVIQSWRHGSVDVLPAGQVPPNPSELLGSKAMSTVLSQLTAQYDIVILDSPPLLPVTDATILSKIADGTLVVVGVDRIHRPQLRDALESLSTVGASVLGLVLNKIARRDSTDYVYYSGYTPEEPVQAEPVIASGQPDEAVEVTARHARVE